MPHRVEVLKGVPGGSPHGSCKSLCKCYKGNREVHKVPHRVEVHHPFPKDQADKYYQWFRGTFPLEYSWWDFLRECPTLWDSGKHWGVWVNGELRGVIHIGSSGELSCALDPSVQGQGVFTQSVALSLPEWDGPPVWARTTHPAVLAGCHKLGIPVTRTEGDQYNG